jgi:hypothetical protein
MSFSSRILPWAIAFALLSSVVAIASRNLTVDLDLYHQMSLYRQIESEGAMPRKDAFAYTPTVEPVIHHEWATGAVVYLATVKTGWGATGLVVIKYLLTFFLSIGCFVYARRQGASLAVFTALAPIAMELGGRMAFNTIRAQLFTLCFYLLLFFLLKQDQKGKRWWIAVWFPVFIIWSNMHGGVVAGMGILGVYCFSRLIESWLETKSVAQTLKQVAHLILVGFATLLLLNLNPYGWEYATYLVRALRMERPLIPEWSPIWVTKLPVIYAVSVLIALYAIWCRGKESLFESCALILTAYLAAKHFRHGSLYAVTWMCVVPPMIQSSGLGTAWQGLWKKYSPQIAVLGIAIGVIATGCSIEQTFWKVKVPGQVSAPGNHERTFPVGPVDYLREHDFQGNLFVPFSAGSYVQWKLYPDVKVSLDSRYEAAYPEGTVEENLAFYSTDEGWRETLEKYDTDALLIPIDYKLAIALAKDDGALAKSISWTCVYRDRSYCLYFPSQTAGQFKFADRTKERIDGVYP